MPKWQAMTITKTHLYIEHYVKHYYENNTFYGINNKIFYSRFLSLIITAIFYRIQQEHMINMVYLDVTDDDWFSVTIENVLAFWISIDDQGHPPLSVGKSGKHTLCNYKYIIIKIWGDCIWSEYPLLLTSLTCKYIASYRHTFRWLCITAFIELTWFVRHDCKSSISPPVIS